MIDWLKARVNIAAAHDLKTGVIFSVDKHGVLEWEIAQRAHVRGSHDASISMRRVGDQVEFDGNPAKFLQGHNLFGSDDLVGLGAEMILRACASKHLHLTANEICEIRAGHYILLRVDINYNFDAGSVAYASAWIEQAATRAHLNRRGRGRRDGETSVVWGVRSRYWKLKAYCKGTELCAHPLPAKLPLRDRLFEWSANKLRVEVTLCSRELKRLGLRLALSWTMESPLNLFKRYVAQLDLKDSVRATDPSVCALPMRLRPTYGLWLHGECLLDFISRRTLYRRTDELLKHGIDITVPMGSLPKLPMSLEKFVKCPVEIPKWATGPDLYFNPVQSQKYVTSSTTGECLLEKRLREYP